MGRKGNIDGAVQKILRVEQREKNNGGENKYCWGAKEILFPFSVEHRDIDNGAKDILGVDQKKY